MRIPRVLIAGLRGGSGKTLISLGLAAAWRKRGLRVAPLKKGPDYIDAAWLSRAADAPCRNLDLFLMSPQTIRQSFLAAAAEADVAVIEGNRGLFDGMDAQGTYSTAELAKLLGTPVVLTVDCTKTSRTIAAQILGCQRLDPDVAIRGVILNQTAGPRHDSVLREAVEQACGIPILGAIPRITQEIFPERHLGLVPPQEHADLVRAIDRVAEVALQHLDLAALQDIANEHDETEHLCCELAESNVSTQAPVSPSLVRIGIMRDEAFQFYYPENLEALAREGARLIEISPLRDGQLPELDALYIGGGFPETWAVTLADNKPFLGSVRQSIEKGLPVYAECGGAVFLGERLLVDENEYPMAGILPATFIFRRKMQGHGYAVLEAVRDNPFYQVGDSLRGHEFHYTCIDPSTTSGLSYAFRVRRGFGFDGHHDGLCRYNVLALYTHVHALGVGHWAPSIVRTAARYRTKTSHQQSDHE